MAYCNPMRDDLDLLYNKELSWMCSERLMPGIKTMRRQEMIEKLVRWRPFAGLDYIAPTAEQLQGLNKTQLKEECRARNILSLSKLRKGQLIERLVQFRPQLRFMSPRRYRELRGRPLSPSRYRELRDQVGLMHPSPCANHSAQHTNASNIACKWEPNWTPFDCMNGPAYNTIDYLEALADYNETEFKKNDTATEWPAFMKMPVAEFDAMSDMAMQQERRGHALRRAIEVLKKNNDPHVPNFKHVGGHGIPVGGWVWNTIVRWSPWILSDAHEYMNDETLALHREAHQESYCAPVIQRKRARDIDSDSDE